MREFEPSPEYKMQPEWVEPSLKDEGGELMRTSIEEGIPKLDLLEAFHDGFLQEMDESYWETMRNFDSIDDSWTVEEVHAHLKDARNFARIENGLRSGSSIPAPIVLFRDGKPPYLVAGNSRLLGCRALKIKPTIFAIYI